MKRAIRYDTQHYIMAARTRVLSRPADMETINISYTHNQDNDISGTSQLYRNRSDSDLFSLSFQDQIPDIRNPRTIASVPSSIHICPVPAHGHTIHHTPLDLKPSRVASHIFQRFCLGSASHTAIQQRSTCGRPHFALLHQSCIQTYSVRGRQNTNLAGTLP